jgi:hypothetical protein
MELAINLFDVDWIMPRRVRELLMSWGGQVGCCNILEVWRLDPLCLIWRIWREWTSLSFEDRETSMAELKKLIFNSLYARIAAHNSLIFSNFSDFMNLCFSFSSE